MRFQLLGPLSIAHGPETVVLKPSKPTSLLAALLLHPGTVVSTDYLLRAVWDEEPPATARAALQTCVLRLRRLFAKYGISATTIEAVPGGYRMHNDTGTLDLVLFRLLAAKARAATGTDEELYRLRESLSLWQGQPLANVASRMLQRDAVPALEQERLRVLERICDLELAAGNCHQVLVDLYESGRRHPVRERFTEQLIEALYRTGRQAEALAEYRAVRDRLRDELGVDPGPGLRRLEMAILRSEELGPPRPEEQAPPLPTPPHPLPPVRPPGRGGLPSVPGFAGRVADLRTMALRLTDADGPRLLVVSGAPGIGKSALAHQCAHRVQDAFPGGVFSVDLGGNEGNGVTAQEARGLLPEPGDGRRLLILDNATGAGQVLPLLPASGDVSVLVTSRRGLAAVVATHGGAVHRLDVLGPSEAHGLLAGLVGAERIAAEEHAARELASVCGYFPLALRIAAGRLLTRPGLSVADCAAWLSEDTPGRLALAEDARLSVPEVFGQALSALPPELRETFLRFGSLDPGPGPCTAGSGVVLEQLVEAGLLEDGPPGQPYRIHAFLRVYARWLSRGRDGAAALPAAR
ncbi:BTAD domain-containing putative transcriptional regulator [Streptomyces sp. Isolate_45]|uniref:BTAD domain-containing putative transcriptional regulator n=1 Tax=Streptomyces sp. Isolate_45 TaxID=2950111 RepID=UPI002481C608|nr:BTAD domain-containing putative transcriptional regulator [Streptomyces sp. Isolate_45]MDA5282301.1 BTAD domain-containing putative transcriptional regulator [Streptomyces sp. Isolate_45]